MKKAILFVFNWVRSIIFVALAVPIAVIAALAVTIGLFGILIGALAFCLLFLAGLIRVDWKVVAQELKKSTR